MILARPLLQLSFLMIVLPSSAYAYIDPATGGLIIQIVIGMVITAIATVKLWWEKFLVLIGKKEKPTTQEATEKKDANDE